MRRSYIRFVGTGHIFNESGEIMAGQIVYCAGSAIPNGYLECNGATVSRTTYATLFAAIGSTYGPGDGATTFHLPDLRGEFIRGWDNGRGVDSGRAFGSAQAASVESHFHMTDGSNGSNSHAVLNNADGPFDANSMINNAADAAYRAGTRTGAFGGTETRPRNIAMIAAIKFS